MIGAICISEVGDIVALGVDDRVRWEDVASVSVKAVTIHIPQSFLAPHWDASPSGYHFHKGIGIRQEDQDQAP